MNANSDLPQPEAPKTKRSPVFWGFVAVALVLTSGIAALRFQPGLAILPFAGSLKLSPYCSVWQGVNDSAVKLKQGEIEQQIKAKMHVIRTEGHYKLWATGGRDYWVPDTSDDILAILLAQQERKIYGDATSGGVKAGDVVLDGGAHVGVYVDASLRAGASKVIAIEPSPEALWCLRRNFAKEVAEGKVVIYEKGIWDEEKTLTFFANLNGAAGDSFITEGVGGKKIADVPVTTVDKIVAELGLAKVDIIKADIKGAGTRMIHGAVQTITKFHPRVVVSVEEAPEDPAEIRAALLKVAPAYLFRPGPCLFTGDEIRNDTIFFE